jgi:hypothetical protein
MWQIPGSDFENFDNFKRPDTKYCFKGNKLLKNDLAFHFVAKEFQGSYQSFQSLTPFLRIKA